MSYSRITGETILSPQILSPHNVPGCELKLHTFVKERFYGQMVSLQSTVLLHLGLGLALGCVACIPSGEMLPWKYDKPLVSKKVKQLVEPKTKLRILHTRSALAIPSS